MSPSGPTTASLWRKTANRTMLKQEQKLTYPNIAVVAESVVLVARIKVQSATVAEVPRVTKMLADVASLRRFGARSRKVT